MKPISDERAKQLILNFNTSINNLKDTIDLDTMLNKIKTYSVHPHYLKEELNNELIKWLNKLNLDIIENPSEYNIFISDEVTYLIKPLESKEWVEVYGYGLLIDLLHKYRYDNDILSDEFIGIKNNDIYYGFMSLCLKLDMMEEEVNMLVKCRWEYFIDGMLKCKADIADFVKGENKDGI